MNLKEFRDYRPRCPFCEKSLDITVGAITDRQCTSLEKEKFIVKFPLRGLSNNEKDYTISYSFGWEDNSFQVDFYEDTGTLHGYIPLSLINNYKKFRHNHGDVYYFTNKCNSCCRYQLTSNWFDVDFKKCCLSNIKIEVEIFGMSCLVNGKYRNMTLTNYYNSIPHSQLRWRFGEKKNAMLPWRMHPKYDMVKLPLLPFVSEKETSQRLNNLVIFS